MGNLDNRLRAVLMGNFRITCGSEFVVEKEKEKKNLAFLDFLLLRQELNAEKQNDVQWPYHITEAVCREESLILLHSERPKIAYNF